MPVVSKQFNELFTYTRGSGATRVNAAGRIVGVDFSSTSNTIGTGSKTFTLAADLSIDRDWPVGSAIRAVDQVGGGTMTGTVTSYTASTQELVINVASITGSGTGLTNWRIGSLEFRRDFDPITLAPKGGLVEGGATNVLPGSNDFANWNTNGTVTVTPNFAVSPDGSMNAARVVFGSNINTNQLFRLFSSLTATYSTGIWIRSNTGQSGVLRFGLFDSNVLTDDIAVTTAWQRFSSTKPLNAIGNARGAWLYPQGGTLLDVLVYGGQAEINGVSTSYIPTTTVAVTRAADQLSVGGANFSQFYNSAQGTLVMELTPIAQAVGAVAGSLNDGTLNNAIRIAQKQSGTLSSIRKMATDGVTDVMAVNASTNNTLRSNGVDYTEVNNQSACAQLGVATASAGNFLSGGTFESLRTSSDSGLTYTPRNVSGALNGAHFGIGRFVVASNTAQINGVIVGAVLVSTDGLAFRRVNISGLTQQLNEVTSNGTNQYVAVGNAGVIYTSPDAETWTAQTSGKTQTLTSATFGGGLYVVALDGNTSSIITSPDGITWTARTTPSISLVDVAYNGSNLYVAVGGSGGIITSPDGITWTSRTSGVTTILQGVHFADGLWVAVGSGGTVVTSPDGTTWTDRTANSGTVQQINEVNFFNGKFYYVGATQVIGENTASNIVANVTWTARTANVSAQLNGIATNGSRILICGIPGAITTSDDGTTFTSRTGNETTLNGAAFGNGTYVVVGNAVNDSGLIATVNPTTFEYQRRVCPIVNALIFTKFLGGRFYSGHGTGNGGMIYSTDAVSWTNSSIASGANAMNVNDVSFNGTSYVAIGSAGRYIINTSGTDFTVSAPTGVTTQQLNAIDYANGLFVAVGNAGTIITSPNGTTWTLRTSGVTSALHTVMYSTRDNQWYAAGDGGVILRSADAITWESIANDAAAAVIAGGIIQANPFLPNFIVGATNKIAMRLKTNDFAASVNGADAVTDTSGGLPSANRFSIGMNGVSGQQFNGHIRKITYFPITKTDAELKGLST